MNKKYVEVYIEDKLVIAAEIKETTPLNFIQKKKEATKNLADILDAFLTRIERLEKEVIILKGEE